jgi:predicted transcriptional regulator
MTIITLDVADDLAAALTQQSRAAKISLQDLGTAVLEQWVLDQNSDSKEPWLPEDIVAIEEGLAQAKAGQTISHNEARARLITKIAAA